MSTHAILPYDAPFTAQITLAFEGSNAIALLALTPTIQVDFYLKPLQAGNTVDLGTSTLAADNQQRLYTPQLNVTSPSELNLTANKVYRLGSLIRIGALDQPALLCGVVEELMVQIHPSRDRSETTKQSHKAIPKKRSETPKK
ncbi:hypothetical protein [Leptothoe sp. PORK10 BA2]|uniref:hypothetical protein n=1 Tax=Leptothoe sp. PORK10 BA2 TaxID=3110254 RepID=UPI002B1FFF42|nr:hypothetical protein [Leptothoe sp. PORK10 BA2]MEA5462733.1 hypothetical protein [Leptothoe sp. PORK10 BA2]